MNLIEQIREYIINQISLTDNSLLFDGQVFETNNIGFNGLENAYKLVIGDSSFNRLQTSYEITTDVQVWIFTCLGNNDKDKIFDTIYEKAFLISSSIQNKKNITQSDSNLKSITARFIAPDTLDVDDNSIVMKISLEVKSYYCDEH